jgi:hypothetical protein
MPLILQTGMSTAAELGDKFGYTGCTLGGVKYESRGSKGCLRGSDARGATNPLFKHHFHLGPTDAEAAKAKSYADSCVHQPYLQRRVPTAKHGDCSGYISGITCTAKGKSLNRPGMPDRPLPGRAFNKDSPRSDRDHVKLIQASADYRRQE